MLDILLIIFSIVILFLLGCLSIHFIKNKYRKNHKPFIETIISLIGVILIIICIDKNINLLSLGCSMVISGSSYFIYLGLSKEVLIKKEDRPKTICIGIILTLLFVVLTIFVILDKTSEYNRNYVAFLLSGIVTYIIMFISFIKYRYESYKEIGYSGLFIIWFLFTLGCVYLLLLIFSKWWIAVIVISLGVGGVCSYLAGKNSTNKKNSSTTTHPQYEQKSDSFSIKRIDKLIYDNNEEKRSWFYPYHVIVYTQIIKYYKDKRFVDVAALAVYSAQNCEGKVDQKEWRFTLYEVLIDTYQNEALNRAKTNWDMQEPYQKYVI